jgi:restriction endonuclease S subunit
MCEGSKVKHIFWPYIARYVLRLPPLDEQQTVVEVLREVDALLAAEGERIRQQAKLHRQLTKTALDRGCEISPIDPSRR